MPLTASEGLTPRESLKPRGLRRVRTHEHALRGQRIVLASLLERIARIVGQGSAVMGITLCPGSARRWPQVRTRFLFTLQPTRKVQAGRVLDEPGLVHCEGFRFSQ